MAETGADLRELSLQKIILDNADTLRTQRSALVNEITTMNDELLALSRRLETARRASEEEISSLAARKDELVREQQVLRQDTARIRGAIEGMEPVKKHLDATVADKQQQMQRLEQQLKQAESAVGEYSRQIADAQHLWAQTVANVENETRKLETLQASLAQLENNRHEVEELTQQSRRCRQEIVEVSEKLGMLREEETEARTRLNALHTALEERRNEELALLRQRNDVELQMTKTQLERESIQTRNESLKRENESLAEKIKSLVEKKIETEHEIQQSVFKLKTYQASLEPLKVTLDEKRQELDRLGRDIDSAQDSLRKTLDQTLERERRLDALGLRVDELNGEIRKREGTIAGYERKEIDARSRIESAEASLARLVTEITEREKQQTELADQSARFSTQLNAKKEELVRIEKSTEEIRAVLAVLQSQKDELARGCEALTKEMGSRRKAHEAVIMEEKATQARLAALEAELSDSESRLCQQNEELRELRAEREELVQAIERDRTDFSFAEKETCKAKDQHKAVLAQVAEAEKRLDELKKQELVSVSTLKNLRAQIQESEDQFRESKTKCDEVRKHEEASKAMLLGVRRTEKAATERIAMLERQESEILERVDTVRNELVTLEGARRAAEEKVAKVQQKANDEEKRLAQGMQRREALATLLKKENDAVRVARERLRELEDMKNEKLQQLEQIKNESHQSSQEEKRNVRASDDHCAQIRADAERTLEALRKRLDASITKTSA